MAASDDPQPGQLRALLFALPMLVYLLCGPVFYGWDGEIMYRVSESLVLRHSIVILDPIYHFAQPYSPYGIGTSLLLLPLVAVGQWVLHDPRALVIIFLPAITAFTVLALNSLLRELGVSWTRAAMVSFLYAFGTLAWHYTGVLFSEPVLALCLTTAVLWSLRFRRSNQSRWLIAAGGAAGLALLTREDSTFLVIPGIALYAGWLVLRARPQWRRRIQAALAYGAPIAAAGLIAFGYHLLRYGMGVGPYGNDGIGFAEPLLTGLYGLLLSPGVGLLLFVPVLGLALVGLPRMFASWRAEALLIAALVLVRLLFFARWWAWDGGDTWGPRYLVPLIPLMLVPIALLPGVRWRIATISLGVLGVGVEVVGQLVPYNFYFFHVVPSLAAKLGICACAPRPGPGSRAIHQVMAFDWHYAPLLVQIQYLVHGIMAPAFGPIMVLTGPVLVGVALGIWRVQRLAGRLDRSTAGLTTARPRSESAA